MNHFFRLIILTLGSLIANIVIADTLINEAQVRGINSVCSSYIGQLSENYDLNGLNITFANPDDPSLYPSLHLSSKKYNYYLTRTYNKNQFPQRQKNSSRCGKS